ncbi:phosphoserine phosphatase [Photobacterium damselae subsp. damselae]|uniref:phosphoserine phosphatase n=1 Tax=Photobacterium damselae TaxID=38293 RepID=UPI0010FD9EE0|nr:phosphoserine phosphatase [Photobacterium damselae]TLS81694.1 phosphoserine phosphatase [Photobacterium damselae subsp. damselae]TLS88119.1 phosphoserine phosphatase [Photobacterium damselae subsp. damselae]
MELSLSPLKIKKHAALYRRFPELQQASLRDKQQGQWILFGQDLSSLRIALIEEWAQQRLQLVAAWQVGDYDVLLIKNDLSDPIKAAVYRAECDFALTKDLPELNKPGLVVMDMDSTAIEMECIDEIAKLAGTGELVSAITEQAMQGELDFEQSLRQRVATLSGADEAILAQVLEQLPLMPELIELVRTLQAFGWKVAIASGGFTYFADQLKAMLDLDGVYANQLAIQDGKLIGEVVGSVVDADAKAYYLHQLSEQFEIEPHNTVAIGDGTNDLAMMKAAGLGIAFHAKPKVQQQAQTAINYGSLGAVLCILSASLVPHHLSWKNQSCCQNIEK